MSKKALIIGSIAYDRIFSIQGSVQDKIILKNGNIEKIDLTFRADDPIIQYGGTGGNISYGLALLGEKPILSAIVGKDFKYDYQEYLKELGIELKMYEKNESHTATFYGIEDKDHQTISIWQPNASVDVESFSIEKTLDEVNLKDIGIVIVSPLGKPFGLPKMITECRRILNKDTKIIFDLGQDLSFMKKEEVIMSLQNSDFVIANDVELHQFSNMFNLTSRDMFGLGVETIIETKGEEGSVIYYKDKPEEIIPIAKAMRVVQVTGAGDAYRAGFIYGYIHGKNIAECCKYGSIMGSFAIESYGGQGYKISKKDFEERYRENY